MKDFIGDRLGIEALGVDSQMRCLIVREPGQEALAQGLPLAEDRTYGGVRLLLATLDQYFKWRSKKYDVSVWKTSE